VKLLGITVDSPQVQLAIVTDDGVRCEIDGDFREAGRLVPIVSFEVQRRLSARARDALRQRRRVDFGCLSVSETGIRITEPTPLPWYETLRRRFESQVNSRIVVPGEYPWENVCELCVARAIRGSRLADHTVYSQLEIHVRALASPVYVSAIAEFPNFAAFGEVLEELGRSLNAAN
jgi:hypothetical protein